MYKYICVSVGLQRVDHQSADLEWSSLPGHPPVPASPVMGYWYVNQPDMDVGGCVSVVQDGSYYYGGGWTMTNCHTPLPFVCEAQAGLKGNHTRKSYIS